MCLLALAVHPHASIRFVLAANRDEAFERPARAAHTWEDDPRVVAGRDLRAGGTWLGVSRAGKLAAVTNVRAFDARREGCSRGDIPRLFLTGEDGAAAYASRLARERASYASFNAFVGDADGFFYVSDADPAPQSLAPGVHAVSNGRLSDRWPKVERARDAVSASIGEDGTVDVASLFAVLRDDRPAPDADLPSTGVPLEVERVLSPPFVVGEVYGTRCSTVVVAYASGRISFEERSFLPRGAEGERVSVEIEAGQPPRPSP